MAIMILVFFALVAAAVLAFVRTSGDIDADEFAKRRDVLGSR